MKGRVLIVGLAVVAVAAIVYDAVTRDARAEHFRRRVSRIDLRTGCPHPIRTARPNADEIAKDVHAFFKGGGGGVTKATIDSKLALLSEDTAPWFLNRFRDSLKNKMPDQDSLNFLAMSGGWIASDFLLERLNADDNLLLDRGMVNYVFCGLANDVNAGSVPLSEGYLHVARQRLTSFDYLDRSAAIGILSLMPTAESRKLIHDQLRKEVNQSVQRSAAVALCRMGDAESLLLLRDLRGRVAQSVDGATVTLPAWDAAVTALEKRLSAASGTNQVK